MADAKGTYNSPSAQGWATVLPSGPNFMGMATALQAQEQRKQMAEQVASEKRMAERQKGVSDLLKDFSKPVTAPQKYQEMVSAGFKGLQEEIAAGIANGEDLSQIRSRASIKYQEISGEAKAGKDVIALVNGVDAMNKGNGYQKYNTGALKEYLAEKMVGDDGKLLPPSQLRIEDLSPEKALYGQGSAGAKFLNKQEVVNDFANSDAMKEISVKWQNSPSQSRSGGVLTTNQAGFEQSSKPFQLLEIDKQGKVKVGIMPPEKLIESGVYLAAANDKDMGLLIDAAADEFFSKRLVPPTQQEREYEEARILGEMLTGQVGGASYERFIDSKTTRLPGSAGGGKMTQGEREGQTYAAQEAKWSNDVMAGDVPTLTKAVEYISKEIGLSQEARSGIEEFLGQEGDFVDMQVSPDGTIYARMKKGDRFEYKQVNRERLAGELGKNIYAETYKSTKRHYGTTEAGGTNQPVQQSAPQFSIFKNKK